MIQTLRRQASIYSAIAAIVPKRFLAFRLWFWIGLILNVIEMAILVFFWRAAYANTATLGGLSLQQTLTYILLAQVFAGLTDQDLIWEFGYQLREGGIIHMLLRPVNYQASYYVQALTGLLMNLILNLPTALMATFIFGLHWPTDPAAWGAFIISALLGYTALFFFHWCLACITFYTTEVWGLGVLIFGLTRFLSGGLVPLAIMPMWLRTVVLAIPFAQSLAVPLNLLTGITPLAEAPVVWLSQLAWLIGLGVLSQLIFRVAVRKVTVQGG
ncbi:MAG: ABC transporter permease [Anaerolineales bacterium]